MSSNDMFPDVVVRYLGLHAKCPTDHSACALMERIIDCLACGSDSPQGWIWDDLACGDPEHCSQVAPCWCNPECYTEDEINNYVMKEDKSK